MKKIFNFLKDKMNIKILLCLIVGGVVVANIEVTHAANATHTIVFNRAEGTEVMLTCKTGSDGKVSSSCASCVTNICARWSYEKYNWSNTQSTVLYSSNLPTKVFTSDEDYYCVAGSSKPDANYCRSVEDACFVCSSNKNVMKWDKDGASDSACSAGYYETDIPEKDCVTKKACYVCNSDKNIMKWDTNGSSDKDCSAGYKETDIPEKDCVTKNPVCYVCKNDENTMKWGFDGSSDKDCSAGYKETDIPEKDCVTKNPVCYVCKNDENTMKWGFDGSSDKDCSAGYKETDIPEKDCVTKKPVCYVCNENKDVMKWGFDGSSDEACIGGYTETDTPEVDCKTKVPEIEIENTASNKSILTIVLATVITGIGISLIYGIKKNY